MVSPGFYYLHSLKNPPPPTLLPDGGMEGAYQKMRPTKYMLSHCATISLFHYSGILWVLIELYKQIFPLKQGSPCSSKNLCVLCHPEEPCNTTNKFSILKKNALSHEGLVLNQIKACISKEACLCSLMYVLSEQHEI